MKDFETFFMDYTLRESDSNYHTLSHLADELCSIYIQKTQSSPRGAGSVKLGFYIVLCNLYYILVSSNNSKSWCIGYSRNKNSYQGRKPGYDVMIKVVDWLIGNGYCEHLKGFYDRETGIGRVSRLRYSESLRSKFRKFGGKVTIESHTDHLIRVKEAKTKVLRPDDGAVRSVFDQRIDGNPSCLEKMRKINEVRKQHEITYLGQIFPAIDIYRVFNNDGFSAGGRFYGEFILNQPKTIRKQVLIEGNQVSELDFSGLHPRLLYDRRNLKMSGDPYTIPGFDRTIIKQAFLRVLNNPSVGKARNSIRGLLARKETYQSSEHEKILTGILEKHKNVIDFSDEKICMGSKLQAVDSEIALEVMYHFAKNGIACIGIHDSFIVQKNYEAELRSVMEQKYQEVVVREYVKFYERDTGKVFDRSIWSKIKFVPVIK